MEFGLSEEQVLLQDSVRRFISEQCPLDTVRQFAAGEDDGKQVRHGLCELGLPALMIDEAQGGVGLGLLDAAVVSEALGYGTAPSPFIASAVMVPEALRLGGNAELRERYLPALASGAITAGAAVSELTGARLDTTVSAEVDPAGGQATLNGKALFVLDFDADLFLVADNQGQLNLVERDARGLEAQKLPSIDTTRPVGELRFDQTPAVRLNCKPDQIRSIIDSGRVILAADTLGAAQCMLDQAVAYAMQREQFNRVIASFQAVKHMCAEMAAALEPCRAMVWYAAYAQDAKLPEAHQYACLTKAHLSEVGQFVARTATEVHGGMGFTDLVGLHYWFKRIGANRQYLGSPERLRDEAARDLRLIA